MRLMNSHRRAPQNTEKALNSLTALCVLCALRWLFIHLKTAVKEKGELDERPGAASRFRHDEDAL